MSKVELTIKGDVSVLRLAPGDHIIATIDEKASLSPEEQDQVRNALVREFPGHEVTLIQGLTLTRATE